MKKKGGEESFVSGFCLFALGQHDDALFLREEKRSCKFICRARLGWSVLHSSQGQC